MTHLRKTIAAAVLSVSVAQGAAAQNLLSELNPGDSVLPQDASSQTTYGCENLSGFHANAAVEGKAGVFYPVEPDLRNFHPFSDESVDLLAELSEALKSMGTTLVYVPVPTKALAMPDYLPSKATDFGFDPDLAATVYDDAVRRMQRAGIVAVNARKAIAMGGQGAELPYFKTDPRLTAYGAQLVAQAIAGELQGTETFNVLPKGNFNSTPTGRVTIDSDMRRILQRFCMIDLPEAETQAFTSARVAGAITGTGESSLFGGTTLQNGRVALVGTEFSAEPAVNFGGFLSQYSGLEVSQYAVPNGGAFAAISTYLTSRAFQQSRPAFLVWENPIQNNLAKWGDQPMRELIAAAGNSCRVPVPVLPTTDPNRVRADLSTLDPGANFTLSVDASGGEASSAKFHFTSGTGLVRTRSIYRNEDQVATGRFFMPVTGIWAEGAQSVEIELDRAFGGQATVTACYF